MKALDFGGNIVVDKCALFGHRIVGSARYSVTSNIRVRV
jgi:hypothetical protein